MQPPHLLLEASRGEETTWSPGAAAHRGGGVRSEGIRARPGASSASASSLGHRVLGPQVHDRIWLPQNHPSAGAGVPSTAPGALSTAAGPFVWRRGCRWRWARPWHRRPGPLHRATPQPSTPSRGVGVGVKGCGTSPQTLHRLVRTEVTSQLWHSSPVPEFPKNIQPGSVTNAGALFARFISTQTP